MNPELINRSTGADGENLLPNPGFETPDPHSENSPRCWEPTGSARTAWIEGEARSGRWAVSVTDAGLAGVSGWKTEQEAEPGRSYTFSGWFKTRNIAPYGPVAGGVLSVQFLDKEGQPLGPPSISQPITGSAWTQGLVRQVLAPQETSRVRLTAGLEFCKGTVLLDDMSLIAAPLVTSEESFIRRQNPQPDTRVQFALNLLANGDIEAGTDGRPDHWTYVGECEPNWTDDELAALYREGRPIFSIGRGRGEWSRDIVYSGNRSLLNVPVEPAQSENMQWYGRSPVDGYWLSDPMPCEPGKAYLAGGWIRPGASITDTQNDAWWYGPLEIRFYDAKGKGLAPTNTVRACHEQREAGKWMYWATMPWVAPTDAETMRLRFGQEFSAGRGGSGRTYADNLAVWNLPPDVGVPEWKSVFAGAAFWEWFREAHMAVKPPYHASPVNALEYETCSGVIENAVVGNIHHDPQATVALRARITSRLGESRRVSLLITRYDWLGNTDTAIRTPPFELAGSSDGLAIIEMPPSKSYGTFFLDGKVLEGDAAVGSVAGRYAVIPKLNRRRTAPNIWAVTTLVPFFGDGRQSETEMGQLMEMAGFGLAWINTESLDDLAFAKTKREIEWYHGLGISPILRINGFSITRPVEREYYVGLGRKLATEFKGLLTAYGNWGVEQSNSRTRKQPVFRPIIDGEMLTDEEYDRIAAGFYLGIKSVEKDTPVLIGNIATDPEAKTIQRMYGPPCNGRFDGAIINAYYAALQMAQNCLKAFDDRRDTNRSLWYEEHAMQRSPIRGPQRRYGEAEGARKLVRTWLSTKALIGPRLKAMTMWGFVQDGDITMLTPALQPRPQFAAHTVMADATADAWFASDHSQNGVTIFEWTRSDDRLFTLWSTGEERAVTFEAPSRFLTQMDVMGNQTAIAAAAGLATVKVTAFPSYVFGEHLALSTRLEARLSHGASRLGSPTVHLTLNNNGSNVIAGQTRITGPLEGETDHAFEIEPGATQVFELPVKRGLATGRRTSFVAECLAKEGAVFFATAALNFATAVKTSLAPPIDGTWNAWDMAPVIPFGLLDSEVTHPQGSPGRTYKGPSDISGKLRFLWDDSFFYLGVEVIDDSFHPQAEPGLQGFMGDSIEFAFQPDNLQSRNAPIWQYELYLPGGQAPYVASRRAPAPAEVVGHWNASVTPTGVNGNVNYQVAIPWRDTGVSAPVAGKTISLSLVVNDIDSGEQIGRAPGGRCRIHWFDGLENPETFGDVTLVQP